MSDFCPFFLDTGDARIVDAGLSTRYCTSQMNPGKKMVKGSYKTLLAKRGYGLKSKICFSDSMVCPFYDGVSTNLKK
ncbi:hypothetical protein [Desulfosporosinus meridiei]|uniref:Uncharacterized protein n=1 Tax=Desulfosporosinus meridiei (strain ATCC BAA-275 / DSM 13257 / KCTC 12902 / NCIMB 13706 / S10) TaxID=768704 RepID=J7IZ16_DESMD|nr:hypothetical protein [Desulfosporosinus meridiei]AFQ44288.1 hypothetical protein Desmer_2363 [Desulfosporosinus meridiei DSM 13257]